MKQANGLPLSEIVTLLVKGWDVTFCGHSLGGAIAHMCVILLLDMYPILLTSVLQQNRLRSIAFGTPFVMNERASNYIREMQFDKFLYTVINHDDFVARGINLVAKTLKSALVFA